MPEPIIAYWEALPVWITFGLAVLAALLLAIAIWWLWWRLPQREAARLALKIRDAKARADVEDNYRKTVGQALGGIAVLLGAGSAYLQFSQQQRASHDLLISNQVSKGFEQLGSTVIVVRLGGIYALEGVMNNSDQYHQAVLEALSAFVREGTITSLSPLPTDIQAALTVIGRRSAGAGVADLIKANIGGADLADARLTSAYLGGANLHGANLDDANLHAADLHGADLGDADLEDANLTDANLHGANLTNARLRDANLMTADLTHANLTDAKLTGAHLTATYLANANLQATDLRGADLGDAHLHGADLGGADLEDANLTDANLTDANLTGANLTNAKLTFADLHGGKLIGAKLTGANLTGANLTVLKLARSNWTWRADRMRRCLRG